MSRNVYVEITCDLCGKIKTVGPPTEPELDLQYVDGFLNSAGWMRVIVGKDVCPSCVDGIRRILPTQLNLTKPDGVLVDWDEHDRQCG